MKESIKILHDAIGVVVKSITRASIDKNLVIITQQTTKSGVAITDSKQTTGSRLKLTDKHGNIGAKTGSVGVLYMLVKAVNVVPSLKEDK